jgi:hypothetical protein
MPVMRSLRVGSLVAAIAVAGMSVAMPPPTSASTCQSWGSQPPTAANGDHGLNAVTTTSRCNAWAVGEYFAEGVENTLVEHWNGTNWTLQLSPSPNATVNYLNGVAATSATNAWAVGTIGDSPRRTLIERWNGATWSTATSRNVGSSENELGGVAAISASNVWAVGDYYDQNTSQERTLIQHWNGTAWKVVPSPNHGTGGNYLYGVAGSSASNVWAVGTYFAGGSNRTLIERWNGTAWRLVKSPNRGTSVNELLAVAVTSSSNAWAVGDDFNGSARQTLIERWNGTGWSVKMSQDPGGAAHDNELTGIAASSPTNVWAVGSYVAGTDSVILIEHWYGTAWSVQPSPNPGVGAGGGRLSAVAASSSTNAWAVGEYRAGGFSAPLALHCC